MNETIEIREPRSVEEALWMLDRARRFRNSALALEAVVARSLATLREEAGISQGELARRSGISSPYLSQIENGSRAARKNLSAVLANLQPSRAAADVARARQQQGGKRGKNRNQ